MARLPIVSFCLIAVFCTCGLTASQAKDRKIRDVRHRHLTDSDEDSPFRSWDGVAEDDDDLVIKYILEGDIDFFRKLSEEDGRVVAMILQHNRVADILVQGQDLHFIKQVMAWLPLGDSRDLWPICERAFQRLNLAILASCQDYNVSPFIYNPDTLFLDLIENGNWPSLRFFVSSGYPLSPEIIVVLMAKLMLFSDLKDAMVQPVCDILQWAEGDLEAGRTPLHVAANSNKTELVRCLLCRGYNPLSVSDDGKLPLDVALLTGNLDLIWELLQAMVNHGPAAAFEGSDSNLQDVRKSIQLRDATAFEDLILGGGKKILPGFLQDAHRIVGLALMMRRPLLLEHFAPQLEHNQSPLREHFHSFLEFAVLAGDTNMVTALLQQDVEVSVRAVFHTIARGDLDMLKLLLESSSDLRKEATSHKDSLQLCVEKGNLRALHVFHYLGYNLMDLHVDDSLLHVAADGNQVEILRFLLDLPGANVNLQNTKGYTPLICSALSTPPAEEAMKFLLDSGADPTFEDRRHRTALFHSVQHVGESTVRALLERGAQLKSSTVDPIGWDWRLLPLSRAMLGSENVLGLLLKAGAGRELIKWGDARSFMTSIFHCREKDICAGDNMIRLLFDNLQPLLSPSDPETLSSFDNAEALLSTYELSRLFLWPAITSARTSLLRYFLEKGVDLNVKKDGASPVVFAALKGYCTSMDLLVEFGAMSESRGLGSIVLNEALRAKKLRATLRLLLRHEVEPDKYALPLLKQHPLLLEFVQTELSRKRRKRSEH